MMGQLCYKYAPKTTQPSLHPLSITVSDSALQLAFKVGFCKPQSKNFPHLDCPDRLSIGQVTFKFISGIDIAFPFCL